jgi:hypothetical protein
MVNIGVILLFTTAILLSLLFIILIIWASISYINNSNNSITSLPNCNSNVNPSDLIQISSTGSICLQNGLPISLYYIGQIPPQTYDYVVAPWGTQPLDVCVSFCTGYTGGTCYGPPYNGQSSQSNFDNCMSQLSSTTCIPPIPIASKDNTLYYALSPTCNICDNCGSIT